MSGSPVDLGSDHSLVFTSWRPDRRIKANRDRYKGIPNIARSGAIVDHLKPDDSPCGSSILFDLPGVAELWPDHPRWQVVSWDPLHIEPSLLCSPAKGGCGDHGFIRDGRWVRA